MLIYIFNFSILKSEWCDLLGIHSLSHGEFIKEKGIQSMSNSGTVLVLCPNTVHILKINSPPCRQLIKSNVAIAIGSDFCPNANCYSIPMAMHLAVIRKSIINFTKSFVMFYNFIFKRLWFKYK